MVIFNSYVKLPEGKFRPSQNAPVFKKKVVLRLGIVLPKIHGRNGVGGRAKSCGKLWPSEKKKTRDGYVVTLW